MFICICIFKQLFSYTFVWALANHVCCVVMFINRDVASSTPCIVSFTTSVVAKAAPITRGSGTDGSSSADGSRVGAKASTIPSHASGSTQSTGLVGAACETKAVQQLYRRLVRPVLQKSNRSILGSVTGVLLSGPPGTG